MGWAVRFHARQHSAPAAPAVEMMLIGFAMLAMTGWVFSAPPGGVTTILDMPFVLLALRGGRGVSACRRAGRPCLAAATAVFVSYFASRGLGPFAGDPSPFVRVGAVQLYLATLVVINFLLTVVLLERNNAYQLLRTSDERYRNFIEHSSEAVWRVELSSPMDPHLPVDDQIAWLQTHAYVAESNLTYLRMNREMGLSEVEARQWRTDMPWFAMFMQHLGAASHQAYSMDGLQFSVSVNSHPRTYITGFRGVIEQGYLVRVWGVARDVTELVDLNERLRQNQDRLKLYARQLVGAEERARRATAVDLHDGIGQQLVGLSMTLDALVARSPPEIRLLLSEATSTVREVQAIAQRVIADLSPPGLYELGLEPALKWLSVYMRSKDNLQVDLKVTADDATIDIDLRVLVFKVIRELLRNVVKHSGVQSAAVTVTRNADELRAVVEDRGSGFEWQLSLFEPRAHGFGLWSVADRVRDAAGEMTVDTGPGRGCRVTVVFRWASLRGRLNAPIRTATSKMGRCVPRLDLRFLPGAATCAAPLPGLDSSLARRRVDQSPGARRKFVPRRCCVRNSRLMRNTPASIAVRVSQSMSCDPKPWRRCSGATASRFKCATSSPKCMMANAAIRCSRRATTTEDSGPEIKCCTRAGVHDQVNPCSMRSRDISAISRASVARARPM